MRRVPAVIALGLALWLAAACSDGDGGDGFGAGDGGPPATAPASPPPETAGTASVEEVCAAAEDLMDRLGTERNEVRDSLFDASDSGDPAQLQQAQSDYLAFISRLADELRAISQTAQDSGLRSAMDTMAGELETVSAEVAADPGQAESVDSSGLTAAGAEIGTYCD